MPYPIKKSLTLMKVYIWGSLKIWGSLYMILYISISSLRHPYFLTSPFSKHSCQPSKVPIICSSSSDGSQPCFHKSGSCGRYWGLAHKTSIAARFYTQDLKEENSFILKGAHGYGQRDGQSDGRTDGRTVGRTVGRSDGRSDGHPKKVRFSKFSPLPSDGSGPDALFHPLDADFRPSDGLAFCPK